MPKKVMKRYVKDTLHLTTGSLIAGAGASAIGSMGSPVPVGGGLSTLAGGLGTVGSLVGMKASVGLLGGMTKSLKPKKKRR